MIMLLLHSSLEIHFGTLSHKKFWARAAYSSYWVWPRRALVRSSHMQAFKQHQRKKIKKQLVRVVAIIFVSSCPAREHAFCNTQCFSGGPVDLIVRRSLVCLTYHTWSLWEITFVIHRHSRTSSQSWADESSHQMCDTGKASKFAAQIFLKFLFRKSLSNATARSEAPRTAGVHEVFVGIF